MLVCLLCTAHSFVSLSDLHTRKMETSSGGGAEQEVETKEAQGEFCLGSLGMERARDSSTQLVRDERIHIHQLFPEPQAGTEEGGFVGARADASANAWHLWWPPWRMSVISDYIQRLQH